MCAQAFGLPTNSAEEANILCGNSRTIPACWPSRDSTPPPRPGRWPWSSSPDMSSKSPCRSTTSLCSSLVFTYFDIPSKYQHRVLFYGIVGAFFFRTVFIVAGSVLMQYHFVVLIFGAFLIFTGIRLISAPEEKVDPEKNALIRIFRKFVPVTASLHGQRFFVRENGVLHGMPLVVALLFLEATDIVFAVDSVPAVFALTKEPLIVFTSNLSAILGLRSIYFLLAGAMDKFHLLKYGLAIVLIFVGLKMVWLNDLYDGHFPIGPSLGIIIGVLVLAIAGSLIWPKAELGSIDPVRSREEKAVV